MNAKLVSLVPLGIVLIGMLILPTLSAEISVGVKAGDWVEYNIDYYTAGTPDPSKAALTWREIEVLSVQETNVTLTLTEEWSDGLIEADTFTGNLVTGVVDAFIIPANLSNGDSFYHAIYGYITISEVGEKTYAGANRTFVKATTTSGMIFRWDKATGVLVELTFYYEYLEAYMHVEMIETNMWQAESSLPIDPTLFSVLIIVAAVIVVAFVFSIRSREKKRASERKSRLSKRKK